MTLTTGLLLMTAGIYGMWRLATYLDDIKWVSVDDLPKYHETHERVAFDGTEWRSVLEYSSDERN